MGRNITQASMYLIVFLLYSWVPCFGVRTLVPLTIQKYMHCCFYKFEVLVVAGLMMGAYQFTSIWGPRIVGNCNVVLQYIHVPAEEVTISIIITLGSVYIP